MPYVGDALSIPFFAFAADGTPATGLTLGDFTVVLDDPSGAAITGVTVTSEVGNGWYRASKAATTFASAGEYLGNVTYGGSPALLQNVIPVGASSVDGTWITAAENASDILDDLTEDNAGTYRLTTASLLNVWAVGTRTLTSFGTLVSTILSGLRAGNVALVSSVMTKDGNINEIVVGDAYTAAKGRAFQWHSADWLGYGLTDEGCEITLRFQKVDGGAIVINNVSVSAALYNDDTEIMLTAELTPANSAKLQDAGRAGARPYKFEIEAAFTSGETPTADSPITLKIGYVEKVISDIR